jgi:hypothetical protein
MGIKDCFAPDAGGGGGVVPWVYDATETYIVTAANAAASPMNNGGYLAFYNTTTDSWNSLVDTTQQLSVRNIAYSTTISVNGKIYIYAGYYQAVKFNEYDPVTDTWTARTDPAMGFFKSVDSVSDGATGLFLLDANGLLKHYETTTHTWTTLASGGVIKSSLTRIGTKLFAFDRSAGSNYNSYDIPTDTWTIGAGVYPVAWYHYVCSGSDGTTAYIMASGAAAGDFYSFDGTTFTALATAIGGAPNTSSGSRLNVVDGKVYSGQMRLGTTASHTYSDRFQIYNVASNTWSVSASIAPMALNEGGCTL